MLMQMFAIRSRRPIAWGLIAVAVCIPVIADAATPEEVQSRLVEDARTLAADDFEGRGIGTKGLDRAAEFVAQKFAEAGLNVVSAGGDPLQEFDVSDGAELTSPNTLTLLGPDSARIELKQGTDFETCSFGEAGEFSGEIVFLGYAIQSEEPQYDDFQGVDVEGKIALIVRRTPQQGRENGMFDAGPHGTSRHAAIRTKVSNAFRAGAKAILFVNDPYSGRSAAEQIEQQLGDARQELERLSEAVAKTTEDKAQLEQLREELQQAETRLQRTLQVQEEHDADPLMEFGYGGTKGGSAVPIMHISQEAANRILQPALGKSLAELEAAIDETGKPHSQALKGWKADGETSLKLKQVDVANVIGVIDGEGPLADETVVIGAHYDHIGLGGEGSLAPNSKEVHNGADDNASGTAALIELARRYAVREQKPARRLVFIAFTGEERGLLGSAEYVKNPLFPLETTVAMFNMDMVGRLEDDKLTVFGTGTSSRWDGLLDRCAEGAKLTLIKKPEGFGPSDHSSFYAKQIPVLHLFTGTHDDYHRPTDDWEKLNVDGMRRIVEFLECVIDDTLTSTERPGYIAIEQRATLTRSGSRPYFGSIPDFSTDAEGYALQGVSPGSPADDAGLRANDIIIGLGEQKIGSLDDFDLALRKFSPGQQVNVKVLRMGKQVQLKVVLGSPRE